MEKEANEILFSFPRAEGQEVQIARRHYKNQEYIDLRVWFYDDEKKVMRPTRKGICLALDQIHELYRGIEAIKKRISKPTQSFSK
jgi:hypothetical protein